MVLQVQEEGEWDNLNMKSIDFCSVIDETRSINELRNHEIRDRLNIFSNALGIRMDTSDCYIVDSIENQDKINIDLKRYDDMIDTLTLSVDRLHSNVNDVNLNGSFYVCIDNEDVEFKIDFRNLYCLLNGVFKNIVYGTELFSINLECDMDEAYYKLAMKSTSRNRVEFIMERKADNDNLEKRVCLTNIFGFDEIGSMVEKFIEDPCALYTDVFENITEEKQLRVSRKTPLLSQNNGSYRKQIA